VFPGSNDAKKPKTANPISGSELIVISTRKPDDMEHPIFRTVAELRRDHDRNTTAGFWPNVMPKLVSSSPQEAISLLKSHDVAAPP
jgi:hypothetical protein